MPSELALLDNTNGFDLPQNGQRIYVFPHIPEGTDTIQIRIRSVGNSVIALGQTTVESPLSINGTTSGALIFGGGSLGRTLTFDLSTEGSFLANISIPHNGTNPTPFIFTFNVVVIGVDENLINRDTYESVANLYAQTRTNTSQAVEQFFSAVYEIVGLNDLIPEADLLTPFYNSYQIVSDAYRNPTGMLAAVKTLNRHVLLRGGYGNLDAFLFDQGILVPRSWQSLSRAAGFSISDDYVEG
tara:strand:- start:476088 stop:476813 length:726 start_codon:yes stop_codon:yes gene_type:complete